MVVENVALRPSNCIRVLVADDHPLFRQGLRRALELAGDLEVVGEAANGRDCVTEAQRLRPDVVLLDINMPGLNGLEASRLIKEADPSIGVVILTIHDAEEYLVEAVRAGVEGYVLKDAEPDVIIHAIRASHAGESYLQPSLAGRLMAGVRHREAARQEQRAEDVLTPREIEVLQLLAEGVSNREISRRLFISEKTVKNHTNSIFRKMDVADRTQAVVQAIRKGWVQVR